MKQPDKAYPLIHGLECKGCGRCVAACPAKALVLGERVNERGYQYVEYVGQGCLGCGDCYYTCPEPGAIEVHIPRREKSAVAARAQCG